MLTVFNPTGNDLKEARQSFNGNSTGIINLNNVRYEWAVQLYNQMRENFWIPEKIDITQDVNDYRNLTNDEQRAFDGNLAYLVFLDSLQVQNLPHLSSPCTAPEIALCFAEQMSQEGMHGKSYAYMIETIIPREKKDYIYDYWRTDALLLKRCKIIGQYYQQYLDNPTIENHQIALIADYILEGMYFYVGFIFFYNLASRSLMSGSADIFKMINRDELSHVRLYQKLIREILDTSPHLESKITEMIDTAVLAEIAWSEHIIGDNILGMPLNGVRQYIRYLANTRLKAIGLPHLYEEHINPFKHLEKIADTGKEASVKTNFFDATVTSYQMSSVVQGWDF